MEDIQHKTISINGLNIHIAELGQGPIVLLLHGFPELWYSWRHQILHLSSHGYRAVAPDLRGYGDTTGVSTDDFTRFSMLHVAGDLVALIDSITGNDEERVYVVGHDWGAMIAWQLCLYRPDKIKGLVNLSVAFNWRPPTMTTVEALRLLYGDDHYVCRFQVPGEIEAELATVGTRVSLTKFFTYRGTTPWFFPKGKGFAHMPNAPVVLPPWLSEEDIEYYVSKFDHTGFTGGLNYYRAWDLSWELNEPWCGAKLKVPTKFIIGDLDFVYHIPGTKEYIHDGGFQNDVPLLEEVVVMEGVAHFLNQEKPDEVTILSDMIGSGRASGKLLALYLPFLGFSVCHFVAWFVTILQPWQWNWGRTKIEHVTEGTEPAFEGVLLL